MGLTSVESQQVTQNSISCPAHSSINNLTAYTLGFAFETDDATTSPDWRFISKQFSIRMAQIQSDRKPQFFQDRATTDASLKVTPTVVTGAPQFYFYTYDESDGPRLFIADEDTPPTEPAYDSRVVGAGATTADGTSFGFTILCTDQTGFARSLSGRWFWFFVEAKRCSSEELLQRWLRPHQVHADTRLIWDSEVIDSATGKVIDLSGKGNHGTIVGTTRNSRYPKVLRNFGSAVLWTPPAAAAGEAGDGSDAVGFSDLLVGVRARAGIAADSVGFSEAVAGLSARLGFISEALGINDAAAAQRAALGFVADGVALSDASTGVDEAATAAVLDGLGLSDQAAALAGAIRQVADGIGISDVAVAIRSRIGQALDGVGIGQALSGQKAGIGLASDELGLGDAAQVAGAFVIVGAALQVGAAARAKIRLAPPAKVN